VVERKLVVWGKVRGGRKGSVGSNLDCGFLLLLYNNWLDRFSRPFLCRAHGSFLVLAVFPLITAWVERESNCGLVQTSLGWGRIVELKLDGLKILFSASV
jgi:hypothetical protein